MHCARLRLLVGLAVSAGVVACAPPAAETERPNIIVILVDALRADYLGFAGFRGDVSPSLDALAQESIRFDRCIAQAPWTTPSVASLFTSLHPQNHCVGIGHGLFCKPTPDERTWSSLPDEAVTLAETLQRDGYETAGFVGNYVLKSKFGFSQGFDEFVEPPGTRQHIAEDRLLFESATEWLARRDTDRPFFLYLHLMDVHAPYRVDAADFAAVRHSPSLGQDRPLTASEIARRPVHLGLGIPWPDPAMPGRLVNWRAAYAAGVRRLDRQIGVFLDSLRRTGRLDDSVVLFTADHGEEFLEHGAWEHGDTYYNEALRVPLLIRLPGRESAGKQVDRVVELIDVMPTLLELAGVRSDLPPMQGIDLLATRQGEPAEEGGWAFSSALPEERPSVAAQSARHKIIIDLWSGSTEIYDLAADPGERHDLAALREDLLDELTARVKAHLDRLRELPAYRAVRTPLSEEDYERLRSLGYVP